MCLDTWMVRRQWMDGSQFPLVAIWVPGIELLLSCLVAGTFPSKSPWQAPNLNPWETLCCLLQGLYLKIDISVSKAQGSDFSTSLKLFDIFNFLKIAIRSVKWFFIVGWTLFYFMLFWFGAVVWYWDRNQRAGVLILSYILSLSYGSNLHFSANQSAGHLFMSLFSICQVLLSISKC